MQVRTMNTSESIGSLGRRIECFRPTTANLVAGAILSALLFAAGVGALTAFYERMPILKGPANLITPKFASRDYTLVMHDGSRMEFDGNSINRLGRFAKLLRERTKEIGIEWAVIDNQ